VSDLWLVDLHRGTRSRITAEGENGAYPRWHPDGVSVIFASNRGGEFDLYRAPSTGGPATRILERPGLQFPSNVAADGTVMFVDRAVSGADLWRGDLWLLSPKGEVTPFLVSRASKTGAIFSPDGRFVAYVSNETGRDEVFVRSRENPSNVAIASLEGGSGPRFSPDGREIYYRRGDTFMAATIESTAPLRVSSARKLFEVKAVTSRNVRDAGYDVAKDGRFLILPWDQGSMPDHLNVILNWFDELRDKLAAR
jgi:Tol biopolymer transport system component